MMLKKIVGSVAVAAVVVAASAAQVSAQVSKGYTDVGVVVGIGNLGSASASFGGRFEHIFKVLPDLGNGLLGIGVSADYYSYSSGSNYSFKYIPIGATMNYHFKLENTKFDPFIGAGLGYQIINCSYSGIGITANLCGNSAIYFIGRAGGRYFFTPSVAAYADVGAGAATLNLGVTFKMK